MNESFEAIKTFLHSTTSAKGGGQYLQGSSEVLNASALPASGSVQEALRLLSDAHHAHSNIGPLESKDSQELLASEDLKLVCTLIDYIRLNGIYAFLDPELRSSLNPQRRRSASEDLKGAAASLQGGDCSLLAKVIDKVGEILYDGSSGIAPLLRGRALPNALCGCAELAFSSNSDNVYVVKYTLMFNHLVQTTPTVTLLPILTSLLRLPLPTWLRPHISGSLSKLPLRSDGVRSVVEFVVSTYSSSADASEGSKGLKPSDGPPISQEALVQITNLLSSVPSVISPEEYFTQLAPQLLRLLDGEDGRDLSLVAGYVIASGILGRRQTGAPGTIGWKLFAEPLLLALKPSLHSSTWSKDPSLQFKTDWANRSITTESELRLAFQRLTALLSSHATPGLVKRLVGPVFLPLWGLHCYSNGRNPNSDWTSQPWYLLKTYIELCPSNNHICELASKIMWDGPSEWIFAPGGEGGVEIRRRDKEGTPLNDIVELLSQVDMRVDTFINLLLAANVDDDTYLTVFLQASRRWLLPYQQHGDGQQRLEVGCEVYQDPVESLVNARLVQRILERLKAKLSKHPQQILRLVQQLLDSFLEKNRERKRIAKGVRDARYAELERIVDWKPPMSDEVRNGSEGSSEEILSLSLSLLSSVVSGQDLKVGKESAKLLQEISSSLKFITQFDVELSPSLVSAAQNVLASISPDTPAISPTPSSSKFSSLAQDAQRNLSTDRNIHKTALESLTSPLPYIRAEGLSNLTSLIAKHSSVIDVPATTVLLLNLLQDPEEYVYLHALRTLTALFTNTRGQDRIMLMKLMVRTFVDEREAGFEADDQVSVLDWRLRIGEGLAYVLEEVGQKLKEGRPGAREGVRDVTELIADAMIKVAGRQVTRSEAAIENEENQFAMENRMETGKAKVSIVHSLDQARGRKRASESSEQGQGVVESDTAHKRIMKGENKEASEDIRVRTSALAILGKAIEFHIEDLDPGRMTDALEMSLNILALETGDEQAILRRAAVMVMLSLVKALDEARDDGRPLEFNLVGDRLNETIRILQWVRDADGDEIVRGHANVVVENLESWQVKGLLGVAGREETDMISDFNLDPDRLIGLAVNPIRNAGPNPRIEEVD